MSYLNSLKMQIESIEEMLPLQLENVFSEDLEKVMSFSEILDIRKVIIVGSGDSYAAALAVQPLFEKYCDCFGVTVMNPLSFSRYLTRQQIGIGEPNSPLVIGISSGGSTARVQEALRKANEIGAFTVAMTNNPDSPVAKEAKRVFDLKTPQYEHPIFVGLRTYVSSILGLIAFVERFGRVRGTLNPDTADVWTKEIKDLHAGYLENCQTIDNTIKQFAKDNVYDRYDYVGDHRQYATAFFGAATSVEAFGAMCTVDDSENWCHINTFFKNPETVPTVIVLDKYSNSYSRILETIHQAKEIGRPILVIGNIEQGSIDGVTICPLPDTNKQFTWLQPLFDCLPIALLSSYVAEFANEEYFRSKTEVVVNADGVEEKVVVNDFFDKQTIKSSEIIIFD